jgi:hypothetical protein
VAGRVARSWELLSAAAADNVVLLCQWLGEPEWRVRADVGRLQEWLKLSFHFR